MSLLMVIIAIQKCFDNAIKLRVEIYEDKLYIDIYEDKICLDKYEEIKNKAHHS